MPFKIVFMGSPEFAVPALEGLVNSPHEVTAVYSQPARPAGRGHKLRHCPVAEAAQRHGIAVFTPVNFKNDDTVAQLEALQADIAVVAAYGLLLPEAVLQAFPLGCINIHPSALPRWRGAAPIHRTVLAGDTSTDICIMQMDAGLDTGAVLARKTFPLPETITSGELHDMLAQESAPLLLQTLNALEAGTVIPTPQAKEGVTYAQKISKAESAINWCQPAPVIERHIRGLNPYPGATTQLNGEPIKIWGAEVAPLHDSSAPPGTVVDEHLTIACGASTALRPTRIQRAGKKAIAVEEALRGFAIPPGSKAEG